MHTALLYARALYDLVEKNPKQGSAYLKNLHEALKHRGYQKLLPKILSEYQKLELRAARAKRFSRTTPKMEQTRLLLELYRKLLVS